MVPVLLLALAQGGLISDYGVVMPLGYCSKVLFGFQLRKCYTTLRTISSFLIGTDVSVWYNNSLQSSFAFKTSAL